MSLDQLSTVDPRRLLVLDAVGRHGSFAAAARSLSLTPSAVSQQIAALERECGVQLVERDGRALRFTEGGERLVARAASLRDLLDGAQSDLATARGSRRRGLGLGIFESAARRLLPDALRRFRTSNPEVTVKVLELEPGSSLDLLQRGELDLAITFSYTLSPLAILDELVRTPVGEDPLLVVTPTALPAPSRLADLAGERWIGPASDYCLGALHQACRNAGFEPRIDSMIGDYRLGEQLVSSGLGVLLAPSLALAARPPAGTRRHRLTETGERTITAWRAPGSSRATCVDALTATLAAVFPGRSGS